MVPVIETKILYLFGNYSTIVQNPNMFLFVCYEIGSC